MIIRFGCARTDGGRFVPPAAALDGGRCAPARRWRWSIRHQTCL